jgi:metal-responsive CopG/Arc/MetJ family transcriptional regulator
MKPSNETQMVHMRLDVPLLKRLDDFRFKHRFESRSEAARWLLKRALDQKPVPKSEGKV